MPSNDRVVPTLIPGDALAQPEAQQPAIDETARRLYEEIQPSVRLIHDVEKNTSGSGFIIDDKGRMATDAHVVMGGNEIYIADDTGRRRRAEIVDIDDLHDVAIVKPVIQFDAKPLAFGSSQKTEQLSPVFALGHPRSNKLTYISPGTLEGSMPVHQAIKVVTPAEAHAKLVAALPQLSPEQQTFFKRELLSTKLHAEHGISGGPLVNQKGEVIGLNEMHTDDSHAFSTPIERLKSLIAAPKFQTKYTNLPETYAVEKQAQWAKMSALEIAADASHEIVQSAQMLATVKQPTLFSAFETLRARKSNSPPEQQIDQGLLAAGVMKLDYAEFQNFTDPADRLKYGAQTACDGLGVAAHFASRGLGMNGLGATAFLAAGAGRFGAKFIPNRRVLISIDRIDGSGKPPFSPLSE